MFADIAQPGCAPVGNGGSTVAAQEPARELNPEPVNVKTVLIVPEVGVTTTLAVTLNTANGDRSFTGDPVTVMFHGMLVVAYGPTTKVPCAVVGVTIEHVGDVIRLVSSVLVAWLYARTLHAVSEADSP